MYTRCPNCDSHFEITQEYLEIANGKVRCGNCEHIFNAQENLYEKQTESTTDDSSEQADQLEDQVSSDSHQQSSDNTGTEYASQGTEENTNATELAPETPPPTAGDFSFTTPSIDIKAKMERIAASLSAATQELKSARKASIFGDSASNKEATDEALTTKEPEHIEESLATKEPEFIEESLATEEPEPIEESLVTEEPEPIEESLATEEPESIEESLATEEPESIKESLANEEPTEIEELEELDLIDFNEQLAEEDNYSAPVSDFTSRKVDRDDMDILKSLIDAPDEQTDLNARENGLLEELDNINQTLSDEADSLDEEQSSSMDDLDDIDNGDDLLAELEQLEKDFINSDHVSGSASLDEEFSDSEDFQEQDDFYDESLLDEDQLANNEFSADEELGSDIESSRAQEATQRSSEKLAEDEVVPSFLTQSDSSSTNPRAMFAWLAGTIVLLLVLAAQYLHVNSIKYAQNSTFRPFLESLCPMTGCALPLVKAPSKIITINHDVRTHPNVNNALEIQLTFKNKATFTQGYPLLEIIFSNSRGEVIARRKFSPDEYLTADIQYLHGLKRNQSQDVKLKIVDPDPSSLLSFQFNYY